MAKGQKRSTRELKKPKADKKVIVPPGTATAAKNVVTSISQKKK